MNRPKSKSNPLFSSIRFFVAQQILSAEFLSDRLDKPITEETVLQLLESSGFGNHLLEEDVLTDLVDNSQSNHQCIVSIEGHTNASFELKIDVQKMTASIQIHQANFGNKLIYEEVLTSILESSILMEYVDTNALLNCLDLTETKYVVIAQGISPVKGIDSQFELLFNVNTLLESGLIADGNIDHYETHSYITVLQNQPVMRRIPHTKGSVGYNLYGESISAETGKKIAFSCNKTVTIDPQDPDLLLAAKKGHPLVSDSAISIDDTLTLKHANLSSGNVHFDGSIEITGEVFPNVAVEASGDIFIHGMVENASLISGHNITIGGGVISSNLYDRNADNFMPQCMIRAEGTITAKYCNSVSATAKKDILIETYSMHSFLNAGEHLVFGYNNGKGVVIGGINQGHLSISANIMGSNANVSTHAVCGSLYDLKTMYKKTLSKCNRTKSELSLLIKVLNDIKIQGTPSTVGKVVLQKAKKLHNEIQELKQCVNDYEAKLKGIKKDLCSAQNAKIQIHKKLYPNIHITINDVYVLNQREYSCSIIGCENHQIQFNIP